ncbi:hypothetical protein C450_20636 [Halococcus salifodinae DSM 8989]|uniref:Uncharacterized protein n=1 Tax=Halococcus salifodinae DSM 8989 TaxID=1227456 RepID=M0MSP0_9EURY|nr:hypothetical protein C450_20636 [Halococcus salifodinae DSM 8989]
MEGVELVVREGFRRLIGKLPEDTDLPTIGIKNVACGLDALSNVVLREACIALFANSREVFAVLTSEPSLPAAGRDDSEIDSSCELGKQPGDVLAVLRAELTERIVDADSDGRGSIALTKDGEWAVGYLLELNVPAGDRPTGSAELSVLAQDLEELRVGAGERRHHPGVDATESGDTDFSKPLFACGAVIEVANEIVDGSDELSLEIVVEGDLFPQAVCGIVGVDFDEWRERRLLGKGETCIRHRDSPRPSIWVPTAHGVISPVSIGLSGWT